jgi:hypothetical protein
MTTLVIAGGTGFVGRKLEDFATDNGYQCIILTRRPIRDNEVYWDGSTVGEWAGYLENAEAVVNLAGHTVNCVHNERNQKAILESRVQSVTAVADAIEQCENPPKVWVQSNAVGYFGNTSKICSDVAPPGDGFVAEVCGVWESWFDNQPVDTRKCCLRLGIVLGEGGGALKPLRRLTRAFLGGSAASGNQWMSWIHEDDVCRVILKMIEDETMTGAYNVVAPNPTTNREFMGQMRQCLGRPWAPPAPSFAVKLGARYVLRTDPGLALEGQRCIPKRLMDNGFEFRFPELAGALDGIFSRWG